MKVNRKTKLALDALKDKMSVLSQKNSLFDAVIFTNNLVLANDFFQKNFDSFVSIDTLSSPFKALFTNKKEAESLKTYAKIRFGSFWLDFREEQPLVIVKFVGLEHDEAQNFFISLSEHFVRHEVDQKNPKVIYASFAKSPSLLSNIGRSATIRNENRIIFFSFTSKKFCHRCRVSGHSIKLCGAAIESMPSHDAPEKLVPTSSSLILSPPSSAPTYEEVLSNVSSSPISQRTRSKSAQVSEFDSLPATIRTKLSKDIRIMDRISHNPFFFVFQTSNLQQARLVLSSINSFSSICSFDQFHLAFFNTLEGLKAAKKKNSRCIKSLSCS